MKINIKGTIISDDDQWVYDWYEMNATSPKKIVKMLDNAKGKDIEVEINSIGGSVFAGSEIYTAISKYKGTVVINIVGTACSAAAVIASAPNAKCYISPTATIMWHRTSSAWKGNIEDMQKSINLLTVGDTAVANAFCRKTGKSMQEAIEVMSKETWFTAQKAVEIGLCDGVMFEDIQVADATISNNFANGVIPREVIKKMQEEKASKVIENKYKKVALEIEILKMRRL